MDESSVPVSPVNPSESSKESSSAVSSFESSGQSASLQLPSITNIEVNGNFYKYDENNRLVGYLLGAENCPSEIDSSVRLSQEKLREIGEKFIRDLAPLDQYQFREAVDSPVKQTYQFIYNRWVDGYRTFDFLSVTVLYNGTICGFNAPRVGIFDHVTIPPVEETKLLERLDVMVKEKFGDIPYTEFPEERYLSMLEDGTVTMCMTFLPDGWDEIDTWEFHVPIE